MTGVAILIGALLVAALPAGAPNAVSLGYSCQGIHADGSMKWDMGMVDSIR
jgi:hypothetical protein